jgi:biopolymer transport protein ExbD
MKNFTCTKCGSNKLRPEGEHYICEYCGATIYKPVSMPKKRLIFIMVSLALLLIGAFMAYKLLYSVKSDLQQIKEAQTQRPYQENHTPKQTHSAAKPSEDNPFADVILKVEGGYSADSKGNSLEKAIKVYQNLEMNKAFYISLDRDGEYAYGYAQAAKTTKIAEEQALDICEKEKEKKNLKESCIPYALNNRISRLLIGW